MRQAPISHTALLVPLFFIIFIDTFCWFIIAPVLLRLYLPGIDSILPTNFADSTRYLFYGITMSMPALAFIFLTPFIGRSSDKFGRKPILFCCLLGTLIGFLLPIIGILKQSVLLILAGRFVGGASTASQPVAQAAVADSVTEIKEKARYLSMIAFAMTLGLLLGPLVGGYLSDSMIVSWFNAKTPFYVGALLASINLCLILYFYRPLVIAHHHKNEEVSLFNKQLLLILLIFFLLEFVWSQYYQSLFLIFAQLFHYTATQSADFASYAGGVMCVGLILFAPLALRYFSIKQLLKISLIGMTVGLIGCNIPLMNFQWIFVTLIAIATGTGYVALITMLSASVPIHSQGWILGIAGSALALAWFVTGFLSGFLASVNIMLPFQVALGVIVLALLIMLIYNFHSI